MLRDAVANQPALGSGSGAHPLRPRVVAIAAAASGRHAGAAADASRAAKRTHAPERCRWIIHFPAGRRGTADDASSR